MKSVVITGSSTGIGRACALMLDRNGFRVFAGVRKEADGDALRSAASESLTPVHIDVTDAASIQAMARNCGARSVTPDCMGWINNAGTTLPCPIEYLPLEGFRRHTEGAVGSLPDEGRRRYGSALGKLAEEIGHHAATGSPPEVIAKAVLHALTSKRPHTRYPSGAGAKRMLFMRRILPDRSFDRIVLRAGGLDGF